MKILTLILVSSMTFAAPVANSKKEVKKASSFDTKEEVIENPTLKTLSGSLKRWSFYSTFAYKGGAINDLTSAERPNIKNAQGTPSLSNISGVFGAKYRLTKSDNISLQAGMYMATPFHSNHTASTSTIQKEFDDNSQELDIDNPVLSYFKTYNLGELQNVSFVKYQHVTRGTEKDYGYEGAAAFSQAMAYRIAKFAYIAASATFTQYFFNKSKTKYMGFDMSLLPYQTERTYQLSLSTEMYLRRNISIRLISDIYSRYQMRRESEMEKRVLQQTIAGTYFFNRDISIAPNIRFIAEDIRADRTNVGLTLNMNL
ncbi:hypothetical protein BALOs_0965 [Halobacteriovorax sp. BALOs_7]|uniref:hypothetical protein n=1 Tax=unclassified Halobacteriovorax TaxID=2639665 RepID=UPI000EA13631|nr:hypothetical protein [Halobacteriovorax sp. BALOs_7]AYF43975.1 hypothetical protein BALOs_0965 [Halobacteriovorax sp. BALOs_7]